MAERADIELKIVAILRDDVSGPAKQITGRVQELERQASASMRGLERSTAGSAQALGQVGGKLREIGSSITGALGPAGRSLEGLAGSLGPATGGLAGLGTAAGGTAAALGAVAGAVAAVTAGVVAAAVESAKLDRALGLLVVRSKEWADGAQAAKDRIRGLAVETGLASEEIAKALTAAVTAGVSGQAEALRFVRVASQGALAGMGTVEQAVGRLDAVIDRFALKAEDAQRVLGVLFVAAREGEADMGRFADTLAQTGIVASTVGVSFEEMAALMSQVTKRGVALEQAGNAISAFLLRASNPADELSVKLRQLGVDASATALRTKGLIGVLSEIREKAAGNAAVLTDLFGSPRTANAFFAAIETASAEASAGLGKFIAASQELAAGTDRYLNLPAEQLARTWNKVRDSFSEAGDAVLTIAARIAGTRLPTPRLEPSEAQEFRAALARAIEEGSLDGVRKAQRNLQEAVDRARSVARDLVIVPFQRSLDEPGAVVEWSGAPGVHDFDPSRFSADFLEEAERRAGQFQTSLLAATNAAELLRNTLSAVGEIKLLDPTTGLRRGIEVATDELGRAVVRFRELTEAELAAWKPLPAPLEIEPVLPRSRLQATIDEALRGVTAAAIPFQADVPPELAEQIRLLQGLQGQAGGTLASDQREQAELAVQAVGRYVAALKAADDLMASLSAKGVEGTDKQRAELAAFVRQTEEAIRKLADLGVPADTLERLRGELGRAELGLKVKIDLDEDEARSKLLEDLAALQEKARAAAEAVARTRRTLAASVDDLAVGLLSQTDQALAGLDKRVAEVVRSIQEAAEERARALDVTPDELAGFDELAQRARELGSQLRAALEGEQEEARLRWAEDALGSLREASAASLPAVERDLSQAVEAFRRYSVESRRSLLEQAEALGVSAEEAEAWAGRITAAQERAFASDISERIFRLSIRPEVTILEDALAEQVIAELEPLTAKVRELWAAATADGFVDPEELAAIREEMARLRPEVERLAQAARNTDAAFQGAFGAAWRDRMRDFGDNVKAGIQLANTAADSLASNMADAFLSIIDGSKSAGEAFKDFVRGFIADLARAAAQLLAQRMIFSLFGAVGGGGAPAATAAARGGVISGQMLAAVPISRAAAAALNAVPAPSPTIRKYASGGIAREPQLALFGEGSTPEAFVPLPGPGRGIPVEFQMRPDAWRAPARAQQVSITVQYAPSVHALDGKSAAEILRREARTLGDVVAAEVSTGSNRGLAQALRANSARSPA